MGDYSLHFHKGEDKNRRRKVLTLSLTADFLPGVITLTALSGSNAGSEAYRGSSDADRGRNQHENKGSPSRQPEHAAYLTAAMKIAMELPTN
jgi:hypothetical protein